MPLSSHDYRFVALALALAKRGLGQTAPNPSVGAVVVRDGEPPVIVGQGWTQPSGRPHAEPVALDMAGEQAKGATLYVTLEPCSHHGKTPPCTDAIIKSGIARVVALCKDPDKRVAGNGFRLLEQAGIEVCCAEAGIEQEAEWVTKGHILRTVADRPFVQVKLATDCDGKIAPGKGKAPVWVTGPKARAHGHKLRSQADAILIGHGTAVVDNPSLTCRLPGLFHRSPIRIVLDSGLNVELDNHLFKDIENVPLWFVCFDDIAENRRRWRENAGAEIIQLPQSSAKRFLSIKEVLQALSERGITRLMVEGGPKVVRSFWDAGCIDEFVIFQSSTRLGENARSSVDGLELQDILQSSQIQSVSERQIGDDVMLTYRCR